MCHSQITLILTPNRWTFIANRKAPWELKGLVIIFIYLIFFTLGFSSLSFLSLEESFYLQLPNSYLTFETQMKHSILHEAFYVSPAGNELSLVCTLTALDVLSSFRYNLVQNAINVICEHVMTMSLLIDF